MRKDRLYIFDTTLRDGAQTQGVDFSIDDKEKISTSLDNLGPETLLSSRAWSSEKEYKAVAEGLVKKFQDNFKKFNIDDDKILNAGPKL